MQQPTTAASTSAPEQKTTAASTSAPVVAPPEHPEGVAFEHSTMVTQDGKPAIVYQKAVLEAEMVRAGYRRVNIAKSAPEEAKKV